MLNIAIVGMGVMGQNHYRVLRENPSVKIVALCDVAKNGDYKEPFYLTIEEMLKNENIDAAIVAVPTFLHKDVSIKLISAKINLLIEKPVASNLVDANEILEASKKFGVKCVIGHVERFNPVVTALKEELKNKEIYSISITRVGPFPARIADVGVLTDLAVHDIDLIRFITAKNILKQSIFKSKKMNSNHEDNAILSFELENEIVASITTNWLTPFRKRKIEVICKEAYYEADLMRQDLVEYTNSHINNSFVTRNCFLKKDEPLKKEHESFIKYLKSNENNTLSNIEDSIITLEVVNTQNK